MIGWGACEADKLLKMILSFLSDVVALGYQEDKEVISQLWEHQWETKFWGKDDECDLLCVFGVIAQDRCGSSKKEIEGCIRCSDISDLECGLGISCREVVGEDV